MRLAAKKSSTGEIERLTLEENGPEDRRFLTRLFKAFMLCDEIEIPTGKFGESLVYTPGKPHMSLEAVEWKDKP
jgi:hypothetical protein